MSYSKRLSHTGLISMEKRKVKSDLIQVFKMLRSKDGIDFNNFFEIQSSNRTRGHKSSKTKVTLDIRKYLFGQRVNTWNSLPQIDVDADSFNSFKNRLDEFDKYFLDV